MVDLGVGSEEQALDGIPLVSGVGSEDKPTEFSYSYVGSYSAQPASL